MSIHHPDHDSYKGFTRRQRVDKAVHMLTDILKGISIDDELNAAEIAEVLNWCNECRSLSNRAPFDEIIPALDQVMQDGVIDPEEQEDLLWLCKNLSPEGDYYDEITHAIQTLHGILHGIMADGEINKKEVVELQGWIDDHEHLKGTYPYDELDSLLMTILADGIVDEDETKMLHDFFEDFFSYSFAKRVRDEGQRHRSGVSKEKKLPAICATCPDIIFKSNTFCFTGSSMRAKRTEIAECVAKLGGKFSPSLTKKTNYLIVGSAGNTCWAFSCYGRKVEKATSYRKEGTPIIIVHESDFWDALADNE